MAAASAAAAAKKVDKVPSLTSELRAELAQLELIHLPLSDGDGGGALASDGEWGTFGQRQYASLGALLSHALATWEEHAEIARDPTLAGYLEQRDLYARLSLKALPPQRQADLFAWAQAHAVLAFLARDQLLERFAAHAAPAWAALAALSDAARRCGCADEGRYALVSNVERLRAAVSEGAPTASKLLRLLPWCANPLGAGSSALRGTRQRTGEDAGGADADRVRVVRVKHAGGAWEHTLDWEELALVREELQGPTSMPARDKGPLI